MSSSSESFITERDISENRRAEDELADLVLSGESILLVGAGFGLACGFPDWRSLLDALRERAKVVNPGWDFESAPESPLDLADQLHSCIEEARGPDAFGDEVGRIFLAAERNRADRHRGWPGLDDEGPTRVSPADGPFLPFHTRLVDLPFRGFLTTNYDYLVEEALVEAGQCSQRPTSVPIWRGAPRVVGEAVRGIAVTGPTRHVIHLHGEYRQPATIVLTRRQYAEAYGVRGVTQGRLFHLLLGILMTRRLIFVGFSLEDPYINELVELVSDLYWEWGEPIHFAILPRSEERWPETKQKAMRLRDRLGIQPVFYEARHDDHAELHALVDRLYRAHTESTREDGRLTDLSPGAPVPKWAADVNRAAIKKVGRHED